MKRPILLLFAVLLSHILFAQDIITRKNGEKVTAKVLAVREHEIDYTLYDNPSGPLHNMLKTDITEISYPNGTKDVFNNIQDGNSENNIALAEQGTADAKKYYKGNNALLASALSALYPFYGIIPAIAISSRRPSYDRLNFPDDRLMEQPAYRKAYEHKAFRIKKGKAWEGFGIGTGALLTIIATAVVVSSSH